MLIIQDNFVFILAFNLCGYALDSAFDGIMECIFIKIYWLK